MPAPTIRLATDDDMRAITSRNLDEIPKLPHLYISAGDVDIPLPPLDMSTDGVDLMRAWGVANVRSIADYARLFPAALIAPKDFGQLSTVPSCCTTARSRPPTTSRRFSRSRGAQPSSSSGTRFRCRARSVCRR